MLRLFSIALILEFVVVMQAHAATTYDAENGILSISAVEINHGGTPYSVTLKLSGSSGMPAVGSEFVLKDATPNAVSVLHSASYTTSDGLAYLPEVQIRTSKGVVNYRMLLKLLSGSSETIRLKLVSMAENGSASYDPDTGELHVPVVDIDKGLNSFDVLFDRVGGSTPGKMFIEGDEFAISGISTAPTGLFDAGYDVSSGVGYINHVWVKVSNQVSDYRIRLKKVRTHSRGEETTERWQIASIALNGAIGPKGDKGEKGDPGETVYVGGGGGTGPQGPKGDPGPTGKSGTDGLKSLVNLSSEPAGANCTTGGQKMESGLDSDNNGILDPGEVAQTQYVCNGTSGLQGVKGDQGSAGTDGLKSLFSLTIEPAGTNCTTGGHKVESGLDADNNGVLDTGEVEQTGFVCNGAAGLQGPKGDPGAAGAVGPQGPAGANGAGVPSGGTAGQVLSKIDGADYTTRSGQLSAAAAR